MKLISTLIVLFSCLISISAQSAFDQKVNELFFNFPRNINKSEIGLLFENDTSFTNIRYLSGCDNCNCILADFVHNPVLNYLKDSATISFTFYDSLNITIRNIMIKYREEDKEIFEKQYNSLSNFFNEVSYTNKKADIFPSEQYIYFGDYKSFNDEYPNIKIGYRFVAKSKRKEGIYYLSIGFFEKRE